MFLTVSYIAVRCRKLETLLSNTILDKFISLAHFLKRISARLHFYCSLRRLEHSTTNIENYEHKINND